MNAVGVDISKGKSMIAILRRLGEIASNPFEIWHTSNKINELIWHIRYLKGNTRIIMEHIGRYYEPMANWLSYAVLFVSAVNPKLIKDFGLFLTYITLVCIWSISHTLSKSA